MSTFKTLAAYGASTSMAPHELMDTHPLKTAVISTLPNLFNKGTKNDSHKYDGGKLIEAS